MTKPVCIVADSTCDLTPALLERFGIKTVPLHIIVGDESYLDGVDFTPDMIYERYEKDKLLAHTAAVSPQEFLDFFTPMVKAGCEVVYLSIGSELSSTYQNAVLAAEELEGVYPVDTSQLTTGMSQLLLVACRMRDEGETAQSIVQRIISLIPKVNTSFVIDTLEYLWKGGRCSGVTAFGANLLHLKPCIEIKDGKLEVGKKYRGNIQKVYEKYILERLTGKEIDPNYIFITTSSDLTQQEKEELEALVRSTASVKEIFFTRAGSTVTTHCGPGTLGVLFLEA